MARADWRRPPGSGNPRELVVRRSATVSPAHGASPAALSTSVLALLSVALIAHVADLASRWEAASARRPEALVRCIIAGFVRHGPEDWLKIMKTGPCLRDHGYCSTAIGAGGLGSDSTKRWTQENEAHFDGRSIHPNASVSHLVYSL